MTQIVLDRIADRELTGAASAPASTSGSAGERSTGERPTTRTLRPGRPVRGSARHVAPILRPTEVCPAPRLTRRPTARPQACVLPRPDLPVVDPPAATAASAWRLTNRGVAVVLVAGLMIMVAALAVVGLTAIRVTGEGYQPTVSASLPR